MDFKDPWPERAMGESLLSAPLAFFSCFEYDKE